MEKGTLKSFFKTKHSKHFFVKKLSLMKTTNTYTIAIKCHKCKMVTAGYFCEICDTLKR